MFTQHNSQKEMKRKQPKWDVGMLGWWDGGMDKEDMLYMYNKILVSYTKE